MKISPAKAGEFNTLFTLEMIILFERQKDNPA